MREGDSERVGEEGREGVKEGVREGVSWSLVKMKTEWG